MKMVKAILEFSNRQLAADFGKAWVRETLTGHDMSAVRPDGSVRVTVYDVDEKKKEFIETYVQSISI